MTDLPGRPSSTSSRADRRTSSRRCPRSGWPSSTTTGRSGARSRCRSSWTSSSGGWSRWPTQTRARTGSRGRPPANGTPRWLASVLTEHYAGDDRKAGALAAGILAAYDGISVEEFEARAGDVPAHAAHPTLGRGYLHCAYRPMVELLGYLAANGFTNYIASGGGRDFMRPVSDELYGIPRERVIGSAAALAYPDARRHDHAHACARLPGRRPGEADPHLEPDRPPAAAGRRQLQRRRPDARLHPARRQAVPAPAGPARRRRRASSPTPPAPRSRWRRPARRAGRWSA